MTLSDKIWDKGEYNEHLSVGDVKEFIKKLKKLMPKGFTEFKNESMPNKNFITIAKEDIDKLAGKELI